MNKKEQKCSLMRVDEFDGSDESSSEIRQADQTANLEGVSRSL